MSATNCPSERRSRRFQQAIALSISGWWALASAGANPPDTDGDGRISYEEFVRDIASHPLRDWDKDRDGYLTRSEASAASWQDGAHRIDFIAADLNGDGRLSADELQQAISLHPAVQSLFRRLDANGDGYLTPPELGGADNRPVPLIRIDF